MPLIGSLFDTVVQRYPNRVALKEEDSGLRLTYTQLSRLADHCAAAMQQCHLQHGDESTSVLSNRSAGKPGPWIVLSDLDPLVQEAHHVC